MGIIQIKLSELTEMNRRDKERMRKQTRRRHPIKPGDQCITCDSLNDLEHHHYGPGADEFILLCGTCHHDLHVDNETWGRKGVTKLTPVQVAIIYTAKPPMLARVCKTIGIAPRYGRYIRNGDRLGSLTGGLNDKASKSNTT